MLQFTSILQSFEPHHQKTCFCICKNKDADQLHGNGTADQRICFRYIDSTILYFLNPKFQASSHLLWLYSPLWLETLKTGFLRTQLIWLRIIAVHKHEIQTQPNCPTAIQQNLTPFSAFDQSFLFFFLLA